ncbi:hypothetical protein RGQ29_000415 [Quercus rubra]|uniref:Uncharacterized protein n=1 Tax=Quercus rubra TaxID=3512 RepID=A0AAN7GD47_QUERU|nr:hypothetical protein RGQ29_000415 [Quercus rubra]
MKKAELIFIPVLRISHLVSTLEFAKCLIDHDDRLFITILSMKFPFNTAITNDQSRPSSKNYFALFIEKNIPNIKNIVTDIIVSSNSNNSGSSQVVGLVLDFFCLFVIDVGTEFRKLDLESLIPGIFIPVPSSVLPLVLFKKYNGYTTYMKLAQRFRDTKGIIVNTFTELEQYALNSFLDDGQTPLVYPIGLVLDLKGQHNLALNWAQQDSIMKWLDAQPPLSMVFLCFGSMGSFGPTQVKEMALGLESSGHRFLWSLRTSTSMPEGFLDRIKGKGMICRGWAPQVEVLAHKAIGGFVSHCAWNSTLESLWYGVPIHNAFRMVKELGLAMELGLDYRSGRDLVTDNEIKRAVRRVIGDNEVRKKVKEMGEMARKAVMDGGSSFRSFGQLIKDMIGSN